MLYKQEECYFNRWNRGAIPEVVFQNDSPFTVNLWWVSLMECSHLNYIKMKPPGCCTPLLSLENGEVSHHRFTENQGYIVCFPNHALRYIVAPVESGLVYTYKSIAKENGWVDSLNDVERKIHNLERNHKKNGNGFKPLSPRKPW